jgi:Tfp pilus assembly protein PilO
MKGYWNNLRPFEKRVFVGVASLVFIVFNAWFVIPHFSDYAQMTIRRANAQKKLDAFRAEVAQTNKFALEVQKLEGEGLSVPPEEQSVQFLRAIQSQAIQSGVSITAFSKQTFRTNQFFLESSLSVSAISGESQLVDFLFNLGSGNSLIRVGGITLRPDPPRQQLNSNIKLVASYQKKPAPRTAPAAVASPSKSPAPAVKSNSPAAKPGGIPAIPGPKPGVSTNKSSSIPKRP